MHGKVDGRKGEQPEGVVGVGEGSLPGEAGEISGREGSIGKKSAYVRIEVNDRDSELEKTFYDRAAQYASSIQSSLQISSETSRLLSSYFAAENSAQSTKVYGTQSAFSEFGSALPESNTAVSAYVWAPYVPAAEVNQFLTTAQTHWNDLSLQIMEQTVVDGSTVEVPAENRDFYFPFYLRVPWTDRVKRLLMVDFYISQQATIQSAIGQDKLAVTSKFYLNAVGGVGISLYDASIPLAIRQSNASYETKLQNTFGVVVSLLKFQDMATTGSLKNLPPSENERLCFYEVGIVDTIPFCLGYNSSDTSRWYDISTQEDSIVLNNATLCEGSSEGSIYVSRFEYGLHTWCILVFSTEENVTASDSFYLWFLLTMLACALVVPTLFYFVMAKALSMVQLRQALDDEDYKRRMAEQSNTRKRNFISYIFHEVRVPFNSVYMSAEWLLSQREKFNNDEEKYCVEAIYQNSNIVLTILNEVLDFEKIEEGKMAMKKEFFLLKSFLSNSAVLFAESAASKEINLSYQWSEDLLQNLEIFGDEVRLLQCLNNLVSNALKFTLPKGSVTISADIVFGDKGASHPSNVNMPSNSSDYGDVVVRLAVKDTGVGLTEKEKRVLFQPYVQVTNKMANTSEMGTGLGLCISKNIMQKHDGTIHVESDGVNGSTFTLELVCPYRMASSSHSTGDSSYAVSAQQSQPSEYKISIDELMKAKEEAGINCPIGEMQVEMNTEEPEISTQEESCKIPSAKASQRDRSRKTILIVEDHLGTRKVMGMVLRGASYTDVEYACNGKEGLDMVLKRHEAGEDYGVILMDNMMPVMTGPECCQCIRSQGVQVPIIACSASIMAEERAVFENSGVDGFLSKPVKKADLVYELGKYMD
eukprot:Nk52_evm39s212 gene=Nk52_evmTU39s212